MKKCFELTPCLLAFLCITSYVEDVDNERSKGMFSASQSGFSTIEVYDLGPLNKIDLSIAKAGLEDTGGTVTFSVEQSLLDSLNNADGTSYQLLPPECYTIENATYSVSPGGDRRVTGGSLVYDPHKIYNLCGFDELKYVLPLRVSSTGTPMNSDRTATLYGFIVKEAIVRLASTGGDFVVEGGTTTSPMNLDTEISFENEWDLTTSFATKGADYVDNYNSANSTYYIPLPSDFYTLPDVTIAKGKTTGGSAISLLGETLPPGNYLLPVSLSGLSGQGDASINIDKETVANYFVIKQGGPINRDHWTVTANTEEKTGEVSAAYPHNGQTISLIDGEINTFWHSKWQGGEVAPPYEIILDMGKENSVSQLGLIARQNALTSMNLEIYAGDDGETWNLIGKYFFDGSIKTEQMVPVKACDARWIRLYIPTLGSGSSVGHLAEIYVYGTDK